MRRRARDSRRTRLHLPYSMPSGSGTKYGSTGIRISSMPRHALFGCDPTPGIVAVDADSSGRARVWRRSGDVVEATEHRFPNWFLTTSLDLLAHLPAQHLAAETLRAAHGQFDPADGL